MTVFHQILANNLVANVTNFTVWFAITFWTFLETQSVFATGMIAGIYLVFTAAFGFWLGSIVDHNSKKLAMLGSSVVSAGFYALALAMLLAVDLIFLQGPINNAVLRGSRIWTNWQRSRRNRKRDGK